MSTITQIRLWYDTGFTEGCTEVPKINGSLPTPSLAYDASFTPSTSDIFSRLKLRVPYTTLMNCSYLAISLDMNNGTDKVFYGWIDKVNIISDTESNPLTEILWHVDLWRTYISSVTVGSGMVNRRPLLTNDSVPPQSYPFRYQKNASTITPITTNESGNWYVFFTYNQQLTYTNPETQEITSTVASGTGYFPVSPSQPNVSQGVGSYTAPTLNDVIRGYWDEYLGLDPSMIKGCFLSPVNPNSSWVATKLYTDAQHSSPAKNGFFKCEDLHNINSVTVNLPSTVMTDDVTTYVITGFDGEIIGSLPWGVPVSQLNYRLVIDSSSGYIQIRVPDSTAQPGITSHVNGTCFTIPLIPIEVTENSWSSYVYSGSRTADIAQRQTEAEKARESTYVNTITGVGSSITSSAMMGALAGGPIGAIGAAAAGGVSSIISGTIGAEASYSLTNKYNDSFQEITDYRTAMQSDGLLMSGSGFDAIRFGQRISLTSMVKDSYSVEQRANDISLYGVHVSEPRSSCQSLIQQGGPIQITNAVVTGSVPVEAKQYIRQRLAQGVRMI